MQTGQVVCKQQQRYSLFVSADKHQNAPAVRKEHFVPLFSGRKVCLRGKPKQHTMLNNNSENRLTGGPVAAQV